MYPVILTGPRVSWREHTPADAERLLDMLARPEVFRYTVDDEVPEPAEFREFLAAMGDRAREPERTEYKLGITLDGDLIGAGGLTVHNRRSGRGEIGYLRHPDHWGRGLATEAADLLLAFGFDTLGLHRIEATTRPDNAASRRVLEKLGMSHEGTRRQDARIRGDWYDSALYAIPESDPRPASLA